MNTKKIVKDILNEMKSTTYYHGTTCHMWNKKQGVHSTLYLTINKNDAENYAYESSSYDEMDDLELCPIIVSINSNVLVSTNVEFFPDWGGLDVNDTWSWKDTLDRYGTFTIDGDIDSIKEFFNVELLKVYTS